MTSFVPGTPVSEIKRLEKQMAKRMGKAAKALPKNQKPDVAGVARAVPLKKVKTSQPVTKAVQDFRKQLGGAGKPMPRPVKDEGFGNGPRRPMPSGKPMVQNPKPMPVKDIGTGNGVGRPKMNPMMKAGGKVADNAAKKGKTKGRYI